ncbi:MAG: hypothetical protein ACE5I7_02145 [Candidatus Binatia bacterium]
METELVEPASHTLRRFRTLIAAGAILLVLSEPARTQPPGAFDRQWQVITVEGSQLPAAVGVQTARLGLFASHGEKLEPIPFQIDERDAQGRFALPQGAEPSADDPPGLLDDNDLLVFTAHDLGSRVAQPAATEIRVHDPLTQRDGWVYVEVFSGPAPRASRDDVDYDPQRDAVAGQRYGVRFGQSVPSYFAFARGKHHEGPNLLNRLRVLAEAKILWGLLRFRRTEDDVSLRVIAYKDGPVRAIRRTRISVHIGFGFQSPSIVADDAFSADAVDGPVVVRLPFSLRYLFADLDVRLVLDFRDLRRYRLIYGESATRAVRCDQSHAAPLADTEGADWFAISGPAGTLLHHLRVGPSLRTVRRQLWYAVAARKPSDGAPHLCPGIGYRLTGWGDVVRGTHRLGMVMRALPPGSSSQVHEYVEQAAHPLEVAVTATGLSPQP